MLQTKRRGLFLAVAIAVAGSWLAVPQVGAQMWDNGGADSNWSTPQNWNPNNEPTAATTAGIGRPGASYDPQAFAVVTQPGEAALKIFMGWAGSTGTLVIASGDLTVEGELYLGYEGGGAGHIVQSNGTVTCKKAGHFRIGAAANSVGTYVLEGGALNVMGDVAVGAGGSGVLECRGGKLDVGANNIIVGSAAGATGAMILDPAGAIAARVLYVGDAGTGSFTQNGGTNALSTVFVTDNANSTGTYYLAGGSLVATNFVIRDGVGRFEQTNGTTVTAISSFRLGHNHAAAQATYIMRGGTLIVRNDFEAPYTLAARSELRGWGSVTVTNSARHFDLSGANAFVIADGFGEDRELVIDFISFPNTDPNDPTTRNGWYAVNRGKLTLPNVSVAGDTVYWGEDAGGGPNRANAVKVVFAGRSGTGTLTGSLLAGDHGDVPAYDGTAKLAGVWRFGNAGVTFASAALTFRYDPDAVAALGLAESDIEVFWNSGAPGAAWTRLNDLIRDEVSNRITAPGASSLGYFAVGKIVLPAGTLVIVR